MSFFEITCHVQKACFLHDSWNDRLEGRWSESLTPCFYFRIPNEALYGVGSLRVRSSDTFNKLFLIAYVASRYNHHHLPLCWYSFNVLSWSCLDSLSSLNWMMHCAASITLFNSCCTISRRMIINCVYYTTSVLK